MFDRPVNDGEVIVVNLSDESTIQLAPFAANRAYCFKYFAEPIACNGSLSITCHGKKIRFGNPASLKVTPSEFKGEGQSGDFLWEIENNTHPGTLYIFNDNVQHHNTSKTGGGSAAVRPFNKYSEMRPVRSAGICTGSQGLGFLLLDQAIGDETVREIIDSNVAEIKDLLRSGNYNQVKYSGDGRGDLGTGIFDVGWTVRQYIVKCIHELAK